MGSCESVLLKHRTERTPPAIAYVQPKPLEMAARRCYSGIGGKLPDTRQWDYLPETQHQFLELR